MVAFGERPETAAESETIAPIVVLAPVGRDARILAGIVREAGAEAVVVADAAALSRQLSGACTGVLITEEALGRRTGEALARHLADQPPWSALPVLALVTNAARPPPGLDFARTLPDRAELVVLQRPTRARTLQSALTTQIASRRRQYRVRDQIADLARKESHLRFLLSELDHRVKNLLAKILGILSMTRREARDLGSFVDGFEGRTRALAEAHDLLNGGGTHPGTLQTLVENVMAPYRSADGHNLEIDGPSVPLWPKAGIALAMAIHELATNAAKYGALSWETGVVSVTWRLEDGALVLTWDERGGPAVAMPTRRSFGTRLIKTITPLEIGGEADLVFQPDGLRWTLRAPVSPEEGEPLPLPS